jgi:glucose-6-phosphate 1-dehydrogenase
MTTLADRNLAPSADPTSDPALAHPHVIVLFGATGDLSRRKLLPGLLRLFHAGLLPDVHIVGTSLEEIDEHDFHEFALAACREFARRDIVESHWHSFQHRIHFVSQSHGPTALSEAVDRAEKILGGESRRLHYLSIPPSAAGAVVRNLHEASLVDRSRIIM